MEQRTSSRVRTVLKAEIRYNDGLMRTPCLVRDISDHGARIELAGEIALPDSFDLYIDKRHQTRRAVVKRRNGLEIGVAFEEKAAPAPAPAPAEGALEQRVAKLEAELSDVRRLLTQVAAAVSRRE